MVVARVVFLAACVVLSGCVTWVDVDRPETIAFLLGPAVPTLHVVTVGAPGMASALTERLVPAVAEATTVEEREYVYFEGGIPDAHGLPTDPTAVEVPTLVVRSMFGPMSAVPPYVITLVSLGLFPTVTDHHVEEAATLCRPGRVPLTFRWRREEQLFMWLPALPLTPFWGVWRLTPPGAYPSPRSLLLEDLPALVKRALLAD